MLYPLEVKEITSYFETQNIWHIISSNPKVISCGDAASKRKRLGNVGIPIFDELKSELGFFINKNNERQQVLVHCRGNQKLDRLKVSSILNSEYQRVKKSEHTKGLINPFGKKFRELLQIFDISTTEQFHPPFTMMTNAGNYKCGIEFQVNSLIKKLPNIIIDDVIRYDNYNNYKKHTIGILTGNGPDSGALLWSKINASVQTQLMSRLNHSFRGDLSYPEVLIESIPEMGISMELSKRQKATEDVVIKGIINLCNRGASIICIACNTTQYFIESILKVCELMNVEFISIPEVIEEYLVKNEIKEFDLLGISHVVDFEGLSAFKYLTEKFNVFRPDSESGKNKIDEIAFLVKKNKITEASNLLKDLIKQDTESDTIIIALTEISTLRANRKDVKKITSLKDSLDFLANKLALMYVNGIFETLYVDAEKDSIEYELLNRKNKELARNELWNILCEVDYEFIPPLSYRDSTTFSFDEKVIENIQPKEYFEGVMAQEVLVSRKKVNNAVTGFMSFKSNFLIDVEGLKLQCFYITTIGVTKGERGNGITKKFYGVLEDIVSMNNETNWIATRTWSTNRTHIRILLSLGYKQLLEKKSDRGSGISTVYFGKEI